MNGFACALAPLPGVGAASVATLSACAAARRPYTSPVSRALLLEGGDLLGASTNTIIGTLPDIDDDDDPWNSRGASYSTYASSPGGPGGFGAYSFGESPW